MLTYAYRTLANFQSEVFMADGNITVRRHAAAAEHNYFATDLKLTLSIMQMVWPV